MSAEPKEPEAQSDDCIVICTYCRESYQAEAENHSEREREEKCFCCGETYLLWDETTVAHHTRPKP